MNGFVPLLPVYVFLAQKGKNLPFLPFLTFIKMSFKNNMLQKYTALLDLTLDLPSVKKKSFSFSKVMT